MPKYAYSAPASLVFLYILTTGLELALSPLIISKCWNGVMPAAFDNVHEIDYKQAFMMRILVWSLGNMFGSITAQMKDEDQISQATSTVCELLGKVIDPIAEEFANAAEAGAGA